MKPPKRKARPAETAMRRKICMVWATLAFCCIFLCAGAVADQIGAFRIIPSVENADVQREDGTVFIGTAQGNQRTAQLRLGAEGRSPEGNTWNLRELLKNRKGRILYAFWRLEAKAAPAKGEEYLLWPAGNREASLVRTASEGNNLWDVTAWAEDLLASGEEISFRMQLRDGASGEGADFDLVRSRIYVTVRLEEEEPALEADLLTDSALLDAALSALPANHWALKRYQEITGSLVQARWPETGVPYYFGGHSEEKVLQRYHPSQPSRYYKSDQLYLNGFDCSSFLRWAEEKAGYMPMEGLEEVLQARERFPLSGISAADWGKILRPGDYLLFEHGTNHVGMILGTPRQLGLTAEDAPELADHLDDPLMIHCGEDPFVYDRFREWIEAQHFRKATTPPDGGVTVSLLLPSAGDAAHLRQAPWGKVYGYFEVLGQTVTVYPLDSQTRIAWYCPVTQ